MIGYNKDMDICRDLLARIYENDDSWNALLESWTIQWEQRSKDIESTRRSESPVRNEQLALLITYGDSLQSPIDKESHLHEHAQLNEVPLQTLYKFLDEMCDHAISGVHILPYFPYTSDDGFSISDYRQVREGLGTWQNIEKIASEYHLMSDLVLNHCSNSHEWFKKFLDAEVPYDTFFVTGDPESDYSQVVRPRPHFVLNEFETAKGTAHVWTTFSRDQVDLNFENPQVLFEMLDTMLEYVLEHKSRLIRLDAIAYLWKELGTPCIHHEKTHLVVKLMRRILDMYAPDTIMITETNVPHEENISYFGNNDEAQMVYQFPLPPLLLYAMINEDTQYLQSWATSLPQPSEDISYFNFCASHDGIGMTPTHGILSDEQREEMISAVKKRGGLVSYKATSDGKIPYELNVNYLSAVAPEELPAQERAKIFLVSQSILLAMPGVPGIYIHSLLGSENWNHGVKITGQNRTINRQPLSYDSIEQQILETGSLRNLVFNGYITFLQARAKSPAFHPASPLQVIPTTQELFALIRGDETHKEQVFCVANLSAKEVAAEFDASLLPWQEGGEDLRNGDMVFVSHKNNANVIELILEPYEVIWLRFRFSTS